MNINRFALLAFMATFPLLSLHSNSSLPATHIENPLEVKNLLDKAINSFRNDYYLDALNEFDAVIARSHSKSLNYGIALWGRSLCNVALENAQEIDSDILALIDYTLGCEECKENLRAAFFRNEQRLEISDNTTLMKKGEEIPIDECIKRVKGLVREIGKIIDKKLPSKEDSIVRPKFKRFIDLLGYEAIKCCKAGTLWNVYLQPLESQFKQWCKPGVPKLPS